MDKYRHGINHKLLGINFETIDSRVLRMIYPIYYYQLASMRENDLYKILCT